MLKYYFLTVIEKMGKYFSLSVLINNDSRFYTAINQQFVQTALQYLYAYYITIHILLKPIITQYRPIA